MFCWGLKGDLLLRVPLVEAIKQRYPAAEITVVVDPGNGELVRYHPDIATVVELRRSDRPRRKALRRTISGVRELRRQHFDLSVTLYSGGSGPLIVWLVHAKTRLGFGHTRWMRLTHNLLASHPSFNQHWVTALAHTLAPLGIKPESVRRGTSFYYSPAAGTYADGFLGNKKADALVAINLGAGTPEKRWSVSNFVRLAQEIHRRYGLVPLVFTNPGSEMLARQFEAEYNGPGECIVAPLLGLDEIGAVMDRCLAVVTGDTSLMHMAFGLKRPTLVLFTFTRPEFVAPDDCLHADCFVEDRSIRDRYGNFVGSMAIDVPYAFNEFCALMAQAGRNSISEPEKTAHKDFRRDVS